MEAAFRMHPVWRGCLPEVLDQAAEVRLRTCFLLSAPKWLLQWGCCPAVRALLPGREAPVTVPFCLW